MRELIFRAYDKKRKKWIMKDFHIIGETTVFNMLAGYRLEEFENIEITQYTGLKDKTGKDVYEGDIVKRVEEINGNWIDKVIKRYIVQWRLIGYNLFPIPKTNYECALDPYGDYEVIGNVHENPELLEDKP